MRRLAGLVERVCLEPAVVGPEASRSDDGGDTGGGEVELEQRAGQALGVGSENPGLRLRWKVEAVARDVCVGDVETGQVAYVAGGDVGDYFTRLNPDRARNRAILQLEAMGYRVTLGQAS